MPLYHCTSCMHEFEYKKIYETEDDPLCDWCGAPSFMLEKETPLEKMVKDIEKEGGFDKWCEKWGLI